MFPNLANLANPVSAFLQATDVNDAEVLGDQLYFQNNGIETRTSASGFGQGIWHATDALRFTLGGRYTRDHNTTFFSDYYNQVAPATFQQQTATRFTWGAGVDYDLTPTKLPYGSVSTGFKPGGGNISPFPAVVPLQFAPETITAYEIGLEELLRPAPTANLSAYVYNDSNMEFQAEDLMNFQGGVDNIPKVQAHGLQGETSALMPAGSRFDGISPGRKGRITSHFLALENVSGIAADQEYL